MLSEPQSEERFVTAIEAFDFSKEKPEVEFLSMIWKKGDDFFHHRHKEDTYDESPQAMRELFKKAVLIPRDFYLGKLPPHGALATRASVSPSDPNVYFKSIVPYTYESEGSTHSDNPTVNLEHEMRVCETLRLKGKSHPNVCRYLGYVPTPDGKNLLGLCFERHEMDLVDAVKKTLISDKKAFIDKVIAGIRLGLEHIHSLGYVHNDLNPRNIVLDKEFKVPIIIDFDSCYKIGESLKGKKAGTVDWEYEGDVSLPANDLTGLGLVENWLKDKLSLQKEMSEGVSSSC